MLIKIKSASTLSESDVTPPQLFAQRRRFLRGAGGIAAGAALAGLSPAALAALSVDGYEKSLPIDDALTPYKDVTSYNNFYEFGTDKSAPVVVAQRLSTDPWSVTVEGEVAKPGQYALEDLIKPHRLHERIYRLRCVEAWSMVIPWIGVPLVELIKKLEPTSNAKFVEFTTLYDPVQMPGQKRHVLRWPYVEGLRIDEATHPLTLMAVGLYGEVLPKQNGAPLRLVVPWKYGFKSIKSIVKIRFLSYQPNTSWNRSAPKEYGFYANVNPDVDHPRWSQAKERRIGEFLKRETLMFNGYADEVAQLYSGMDLTKQF